MVREKQKKNLRTRSVENRTFSHSATSAQRAVSASPFRFLASGNLTCDVVGAPFVPFSAFIFYFFRALLLAPRRFGRSEKRALQSSVASFPLSVCLPRAKSPRSGRLRRRLGSEARLRIGSLGSWFSCGRVFHRCTEVSR